MKEKGIFKNFGENTGKAFDGFLLAIFALSLAVVIASVCARVVSPAWMVSGYPSYHGYPKNVELKALIGVMALTPLLSVLFSMIRPVAARSAAAVAALAAGAVLAYPALRTGPLLAWMPPLLSVISLLAVLYRHLERPSDRLGSDGKLNPFLFIAAGAVGSLYYAIVSLNNSYSAEALDLHHFGERFTSAIDFLEGGRPFVTFFWPHGLHDTGVTALFFSIFKRMDLPTLFLADGAAAGLAAVTILLLARGLGLKYFSLLILAALLLLNRSLFFTPLGFMVFVLLSFFMYARAKSRYMFFLSGVVGFLAHIYRVDYGVYGFLSVAALGGYLAAAHWFSGDFKGVKESILSLLLYMSGIAVSALASYLVLGWPNLDWYRTYFLILPKYLTDSAGFPYPLPIEGNRHPQFDIRGSVAYVAMVIGLLAVTARYLFYSLKKAQSVDRFFVLAAFFSIVSVRTAFGRSAFDHVLQFSGFISLLLCMLASRAVCGTGLNRWLKAAAVIGIFTFYNFRSASFADLNVPSLRMRAANAAVLLSEYGDKAPAQCSSGLFSRRNLESGAFFYYDLGICEVKKTLDRYGIGDRQLLVTHSASLIYPSLGYHLPTRYYCLGWAITDDMQLDLVSELERSGVKAVLKVKKIKGINALSEYDIPDEVRLPVYSSWLAGRFDLENPVRTSLGDIYLRRDIAEFSLTERLE